MTRFVQLLTVLCCLYFSELSLADGKTVNLKNEVDKTDRTEHAEDGQTEQGQVEAVDSSTINAEQRKDRAPQKNSLPSALAEPETTQPAPVPCPPGEMNLEKEQNDKTTTKEPRWKRRLLTSIERNPEAWKTKLETIMESEGDSYSEKKYKSYRARLVIGSILTPLGGVAMGAFAGWGLSAIVLFPSHAFDEKRHRVILFSGLASGAAILSIGIPLMITGMIGSKRQQVLKMKKEILGSDSDVNICLSLQFDPSTSTAGLMLKSTF